MQKGLPPIPFTPTLPTLIRQAADRFGDDDFVVMPERRLSFAQAERVTATLGRRLLAAGVGKGTRIGIILPTGVDWVVSWLAAGRIGAFPMLFPATYRPAELRRAMRIGDVDVLIAAPTLLGKDFEAFLEEAVPSLVDHDAAEGPLRDPEVPFLRSVWMTGGSSRAWATPVDTTTNGPSTDGPSTGAHDPGFPTSVFEAVESEVSPADPLLVIYTSGSSADPKAIVHTHGAAIRKVQAELGICLPGSHPGRTFCAMPFFWVGGPQDLLGAMHSGAAVVSQERFDVAECLEMLERERCTSILGWASVYDQLRADPTYESRDLSALQLPTHQGVTSSRGDPVNLGMTETFGPHANPDWFDYKVIDPDTGETLPIGEEGAFCVRGFGLMAGRYKQEREDTFDPEGWYHTGDRGYIEDGRIWFTGRYTEMVKSGGANVAPLEVEQVLLGLDAVGKAFVMGVRDPKRGETVAAVVVPAPGADPDTDALTDSLTDAVNAQLSSYKVPRRWRIVDEAEVPWLASGKPDKRTMRTWFE